MNDAVNWYQEQWPLHDKPGYMLARPSVTVDLEEHRSHRCRLEHLYNAEVDHSGRGLKDQSVYTNEDSGSMGTNIL